MGHAQTDSYRNYLQDQYISKPASKYYVKTALNVMT